MRGLLRSTLTQNAKYLAVGFGAFALAGGTATTVTLSSSGSPSPSPRSTHASAEPQDDKAAAADKADDANEADEADKADKADKGVRPTDTHGYCVSHAVAAAKAAHKTGRDIAAAAHSCPKPGHQAKKGKSDKGKSADKGKSSTAPGRTPAP